MELDDITGAIVDAATKIHIDLGPGLLESVSAFLRISAPPREFRRKAKNKLTRRRGERGVKPIMEPDDITGAVVVAATSKEGLYRIVSDLPFSAFSAPPRESPRGLMT